MMRGFIWFIPSIAVTLTILLLSTAFSAPFQIEGVGHLDKIEHALAYFTLCVTFLFSFYKSGTLNRKIWFVIPALCMLYGVSLEFVQYTFFPNRYFEWYDALANASGVVVGVITFSVFKRVK